MRAIRPYFDEKTMKDIYFAYFYPYLHSRDKILGPYIRSKPQKSYSSAKSLLESYYEEKPEGHISPHFKTIQIMP